MYFATDRVASESGTFENESVDFHQKLSFGIAKVPVRVDDEQFARLDNSSTAYDPHPKPRRFVDFERELGWSLVDDKTSTSVKRFPNLPFDKLSGQKDVLVFVHGYATTFQSALTRAAMISVFARRPVILYSWPSQGSVLPPQKSNPLIKLTCAPCVAYAWDLQRMLRSRANFSSFLNLIEQHLGKNNVSILAHSMGNALLFDTLVSESSKRSGDLLLTMPKPEIAKMRADLKQPDYQRFINPEANLDAMTDRELSRLHTIITLLRGAELAKEPRFQSVYMLAPDVDLDMFRRNLAELLLSTKSVALLVNENDLALKASRLNADWKRLGGGVFFELGSSQVALRPLRIFDCSAVGEAMEFNHNISVDLLGALLSGNQFPPGFTKKPSSDGIFRLVRQGKPSPRKE